MALGAVLYEKADDIVKITMNRPDKLNAQNRQLLEELEAAFIKADKDNEVRVIVLAGAGRSFCCGHDLSALATGEVEPVEASLERQQRVFVDVHRTIRDVTKPTIAQVQGHCIAGGLMTATMCDLIVASDDAKFSNPVTRMTLVSTQLLVEPWEMGVRRAKEFIWTGDPIDAGEAWRLNLVNRVVPREKLEEEVMKLAKKIALLPPFAVMLSKRSLNRTLDIMGQRDAWDYHFMAHMVARGADEMKRFNEQARKEGGGLTEYLRKRDGAYREGL